MTTKRPLMATDLFALRLVYDPQISPDGDRVAFVVRQMNEEKDDYVSNIYVADRAGTVTQFTAGDKDSTPRWSPDGRYLAFLSGRKEKTQIYLMRAGGGEGLAVTDQKLGAGPPVWSPDGTAIAFAAWVSIVDGEETEKKDGDTKKKEPTRIIDRSSYKEDHAGFLWDRRRHLFLVDLASRSVTQLTNGDFHDGSPNWAPDSRAIVFNSDRTPRWDVANRSDVYVVPREGGEAQLIVTGEYREPVFSPDGSRIAFAGFERPEDDVAPERLYSVDRSGSDLVDELGSWDGGMANALSSDVVLSENGLDLTWSDDGLLFIGTVRGEANIYRASEGAVTPVTSGRHTVTDFSTAQDGIIAFTCADATHLPEVFLRCRDETWQVTHEGEIFLDEVEIATPERFTFVGADGQESEGWLLPPRGHESGAHPLIVYVHGGPATAHGEALHFEYQLLAANGFGVFFPNIHGSASYGRAYQTSIVGDWGNLDYQDVIAGAEAAASRPWVDRERIGIAGGSYGGFMANWVVGHTDRFKAALTERCLSNMISFVGTSDGGWWWNRSFGAFPEENVQYLWERSPVKYAAQVQTPLLVIHSTHDDRCPLEQGEQMFNALRRLGKETKLIVFPDESHELTRSGTPSRRLERLGHVLDWFRLYL